MVTIDLSFLSSAFPDLNFFFTNLARSEQMKDMDMNSKTYKKEEESAEDISSTVVSVSYSDGSISLQLSTNDNNKHHVWKENFYMMAKTILPQKITEVVSSFKSDIIDQIKAQNWIQVVGLASTIYTKLKDIIDTCKANTIQSLL